MKTKRTKEWYKAQAQKLEEKQHYDVAANPARIAPAILDHKLTISPNPNDLDFDFTPTVARMLASDGQPNQEFWKYWQTTLAPGAMKLFNPKNDIIESGVTIRKNAAGKWTMVVNGVEATGSLDKV